MQDELTTKMHAEFFGDEYTEEEWSAIAVFGALRRGILLADALASNGLTEARYYELSKTLFGD